MALHFDEMHESRLGSDENVDFKLHVFADATDPLHDEAEVRTYARSVCPSTYAGLYRGEANIDEKITTHSWKVTVHYEPNEWEIAVGATQKRYTTAGGTQHILATRSNRSRHFTGLGTAPDNKGLVPGGADIPLSVFEWEIEKLMTDGQAEALEGTFRALTGSINAAEFKGHPAGTTLFRGATSAPQGNGTTAMSFGFASRDHETDVAMFGVTIPLIEAWDLVYTVGNVDANGVEIGQFIYVDTVLLRKSWDPLGLGS